MSSRNYRHGGRIVVGITSRSSERDLKWLMDFIKTAFYDYVSDVTYLPISNTNRVEWERNVSACSYVILYHTKRLGRINITDVEGALYDEELQILSTTLGRSNVMVVLDDLENCSDTEKQRILESQPSLKRLSANLLLFPKDAKYEEAMKKKEDFIRLLGIKAAARDPQPNTTKAKDTSSYSLSGYFSWFSLDKISNIISDRKTKLPSTDIAPVLPQSRLKIGIFSRSAESNYDWLVEWLKATYLTRPVDVRAVCISNDASHFYTELSHCSFAILYHTKKQGRINVTDVTDNLYDEKLQDLSMTLGKENVIVVIDDLQKTDSSEKDRILRNQPSIGRLAGALLLFKEKKKSSENLEEIEQILRKKIPSNEIMASDGRGVSAENKNKESRMQTWPSDSYRSHSAPTEDSRKPNKSTLPDTTRTGAYDSRGPQAERRNVAPMGPTLPSAEAYAAVEATIQEAITMIQKKYQEYEKIKEEESRDKIQRIQGENEEIYSQLLEANTMIMYEKEKERTINQLCQDLDHKDNIRAENKDTIRKKEDTINELRKTLSGKEELEIRSRNQTERAMEKLHQDLRDKDKTIEEDKEKIRKMEDTIKELRKTLSEKEELEIRSRNQTERAVEKLHQDLRHKDKTIEEDKEKIRKMEEKIQHLLNTNHCVETNPRQEQAGQNPTQQYQGTSPIHGQEDDEANEIEMSNRNVKNGNRKEEGFLPDRTQRNSAIYNPGQEPAETQSLREANEEPRRIIQEKDEEIQNLKTWREMRR